MNIVYLSAPVRSSQKPIRDLRPAPASGCEVSSIMMPKTALSLLKRQRFAGGREPEMA
jgi:hypothetical protein